MPTSDGSVRGASHALFEINGRDGHGRTALHVAAATGLLSLCGALLDHPAYVEQDAKDHDSRTALHHAASHGHSEVCHLLLNHGDFTLANAADTKGHTALHCAAAGGHSEASRVVLDHARFSAANARDLLERTALHHAARNGLPKVCRTLLDHPTFSDLFAKDCGGNTALQCAKLQNDANTCQVILEHPRFIQEMLCKAGPEDLALLDEIASMGLARGVAAREATWRSNTLRDPACRTLDLRLASSSSAARTSASFSGVDEDRVRAPPKQSPRPAECRFQVPSLPSCPPSASLFSAGSARHHHHQPVEDLSVSVGSSTGSLRGASPSLRSVFAGPRGQRHERQTSASPPRRRQASVSPPRVCWQSAGRRGGYADMYFSGK